MRYFLFLALLAGMTMGLADARADREPIWSYDGSENSEINWPYLRKDYAVCETGLQQSPINISTTDIEPLPALDIRYAPSPAHMETMDHALVVVIGGDNTLREDGHVWRLTQLRLHMPGEHMVEGRYWLLEMEFVHQDRASHTLILSVFANQGDSGNTALRSILAHSPDASGEGAPFTFDPAALLPKARGYYAYTGSLTYPPCTEGVEWRILKQPVDVAMGQLKVLAHFIGRNARRPQPVYMRIVKESQ